MVTPQISTWPEEEHRVERNPAKTKSPIRSEHVLMKKSLMIGLIGIAVSALLAAESSPKDKVTNAAKQLGDKPNYSWTTTSKEADGSPGRLGTIEGKTEKIVLIKADEEVEYGAVMAVMDQLRQAAIEDVGLITEKRKDASGGAGGQ